MCGHPGQGKTVVLNQVLFNHFGDLDSSLGGTSEDLYILKYNAMRFKNSAHFAQTLQKDLKQLIEVEFRNSHGSSLSSKLIKTLRNDVSAEKAADRGDCTNEVGFELSTEGTEVLISQLRKLRRKRPHTLILIDEIDAFAR